MTRKDTPNCQTDPPGEGWFNIPGVQKGPRPLGVQLEGVIPVLEMMKELGNSWTALDLGCAEGLIAFECVKYGAGMVYGMDIVQSRIETACSLSHGLGYADRTNFGCFDLEKVDLIKVCKQDFDVVLTLAIAHKVAFPEDFIYRAASLAQQFYVTRLPTAVFEDPRSSMRTINTEAILRDLFRLRLSKVTSWGETVLVFERR